MSHKKLVTQVIDYTLILLLSAACATPQPTPTPTPIPEPTTTPTAILTEAVTEWFYVALGDSEAVCCGERSYPEYYADLIEQDLNIKVNLHNLGAGGLTSGNLLERLRGEYYRNIISKADVVTVNIGGADFYIKCDGLGGECGEEVLVTFRSNYAAILEEILTLRSTENTIIRTQDDPNPFVNEMKEAGVFEEWKAVFDSFSEQTNVESCKVIPVMH